jgi:hypothetical protein
MKRFFLYTCLYSFLLISAKKPDNFPEVQITNGLIKVNLYLPDVEKGYYRATRFDWSGVISSLEFKDHSYFGQWFDDYNPEIHDAIMGPVEEFTPVGFDKAKPGEAFLKPGVGIIVRPDHTPYSSFKLYIIKNPGVWKVIKKADQVEFVHVVQDAVYAYEYKKSVQLVKGKPEMVLIHTFKNTGLNPVETNVYDHNFFIIDNYHSGPDVRVKLAFNPGGKFQGPQDVAKFENNQLLFKRALVKGESIYCDGFSGVGDTPDEYDIRIENIKTGAGVRITCDQPLLKLVFWACPATACPEPYIHVKIDPGQEYSWKIKYDFYTFDKENK